MRHPHLRHFALTEYFLTQIANYDTTTKSLFPRAPVLSAFTSYLLAHLGSYSGGKIGDTSSSSSSRGVNGPESVSLNGPNNLLLLGDRVDGDPPPPPPPVPVPVDPAVRRRFGEEVPLCPEVRCGMSNARLSSFSLLDTDIEADAEADEDTAAAFGPSVLPSPRISGPRTIEVSGASEEAELPSTDRAELLDPSYDMIGTAPVPTRSTGETPPRPALDIDTSEPDDDGRSVRAIGGPGYGSIPAWFEWDETIECARLRCEAGGKMLYCFRRRLPGGVKGSIIRKSKIAAPTCGYQS